MRLLRLLAVAALPFALAQSSNSANPSNSVNPSNSGGSSNAPQVTVITSVSSSVGLISRTETTVLTTILITSTIQPTQPSPTPDPNSQSSSASTTTTTANLPTGTAAVVSDLAPSPGATGGAYGPDDGYINAARPLQRNALLLVGLGVVGGFLAI